MRPDVLEGTVLQVLDAGTLDVEVRRFGRDNRLSYRRRERVRVSGWRGAADGRPDGGRGPSLEGRSVKVLVHARDHQSMIFGDVEILQDGDGAPP